MFISKIIKMNMCGKRDYDDYLNVAIIKNNLLKLYLLRIVSVKIKQ